MDRSRTLDRALSRAGVGSRTQARAWIAAGRVRVNGRVVREAGRWIDPLADHVTLDGRELKPGCDSKTGKKLCCKRSDVGTVRSPGATSDTTYVAYKCQLSFPNVLPDKNPPENLMPGEQNDGVHYLVSDHKIGLVVYGFDAYVSYGYPGGTDLALINLK